MTVAKLKIRKKILGIQPMDRTNGISDLGPPPAYEDIETAPSAPPAPMISRDFGPTMASTRKYVRASRASLTSSTRSPRSRSRSRAGAMTPALRKEEPSLIK